MKHPHNNNSLNLLNKMRTNKQI